MIGGLIDSGASQQTAHSKLNMTNFKKFESPLQVKLADSNTIQPYGKGDNRFTAFENSKEQVIFLKDVPCVPRIRKQLL